MGFEYAKEEYGIVCPKVHLLKSEHDEMDVLSESEQQDLMNHLLKIRIYMILQYCLHSTLDYELANYVHYNGERFLTAEFMFPKQCKEYV